MKRATPAVTRGRSLRETRGRHASTAGWRGSAVLPQAQASIDETPPALYLAGHAFQTLPPPERGRPEVPMKVRNSLKSLRSRHRDNQLVRRRGRVYVINKTQRRFKARQG